MGEHAGDLGAWEAPGGGPEGDLEGPRAPRGAQADPLEFEITGTAEVAKGAGDALHRAGKFALEEGAGVDRDDLLGIAPVHAEPKAAAHLCRRELDLVAVPPGVLRMADRPHHGVDLVGGELPDALEARTEVSLLGCELRAAGEVTPGAAAANVHQRAGRVHAVGGGLEQRGRTSTGEARLLLHHLRLHDVADEASGDEDRAAGFIVGEAVRPVHHGFDGELHARPFGSVSSRKCSADGHCAG